MFRGKNEMPLVASRSSYTFEVGMLVQRILISILLNIKFNYEDINNKMKKEIMG